MRNINQNSILVLALLVTDQHKVALLMYKCAHTRTTLGQDQEEQTVMHSRLIYILKHKFIILMHISIVSRKIQ